MDEKKKRLQQLNITRVNPNYPVPLYHQVYTDLQKKIRSGVLQPGDMLPAEIDLAHAYSVGRQTIRAAISRLVNENLVERFAGLGTIVRAPSVQAQFYLDRSFTQQMAELGLPAHSTVLRNSMGTIDRDSPVELQARLGAPAFSLVRLRFGGDIPIAIQTTTIVTELCPGISNNDFAKQSLYEILSRDYQVVITRITHAVSAVLASDIHSELLQTNKGAPLLLVRTTAFLSTQEPIEATTSYYRADRYEFCTDQQFSDLD